MDISSAKQKFLPVVQMAKQKFKWNIFELDKYD